MVKEKGNNSRHISVHDIQGVGNSHITSACMTWRGIAPAARQEILTVCGDERLLMVGRLRMGTTPVTLVYMLWRRATSQATSMCMTWKGQLLLHVIRNGYFLLNIKLWTMTAKICFSNFWCARVVIPLPVMQADVMWELLPSRHAH